MAWLGMLMVVVCFMATFLVLAICLAGSEETNAEPTLLGKAAMTFFLILMYAVGGVVGAILAAPIFLPLSWLSVLVLRWASRGPKVQARPTLSA